MDMNLANSLNQTQENPEGRQKVSFQPQQGKFLDVYAGPN